ncbi:helix-turn-helix transcriptional regulator [Enterobacter kobei]|uniref:helix-turn-helix transcriptional regulator n=1 Tax=Enterobacter kobei TaxID=208224 RepID=UPI000994632A|nr:AlpA family transcriptional regulator [Enterobacter kobei]OOV76843.1 dipicolinate synthase [Enterobacter kobei]
MNQHSTRLIRLPEVLHRTGYGKAWIYHLINQKLFPSPVKIGARAVAFIESEVEEWIQLTIDNSRNNVA